MNLSPAAVTFCLLSFEGPDPYALAGGLGVRVTHLAETLARRGFETHLFFIGDPQAPGLETRLEGRLTLHRWGQWISAYHPAGVYAAEEDKRRDFSDSAPPFILDHVIRPALEAGRLPVVLAEEWHTTDALLRLHDQMHQAGLGGRAVFFWNANNVMSFHRVDWHRLAAVAQLTTVSRYMKHLMWGLGVNPLVIPNGIPAALLRPVASKRVATLRKLFDPGQEAILFFKAGRFDPAKRWLMAVEAAALLKARGHRVVFPLIGGIEPHGAEVLSRASALGLSIADVEGPHASWDDLVALLRAAPPADLYNLRFYVTQDLLRPFYVAADAVLANSGHEPFGLVGLEAMAAGGLVYTGATGEEYAFGGPCAIVLDTDQPEEIVTQVLGLRANPYRAGAIRRSAQLRAAEFTWDEVSNLLLDKVAFVAWHKGLLTTHHTTVERVRDVVPYPVVHQPRRLKGPARSLPEEGITLEEVRFEEPLNERYIRAVQPGAG